MKNKFLAVALMAACLSPYAEGKKVLGHDDFDAWKSVRNFGLSNNGEWESYAVNPQEGDGTLVFYNTRTGKEIAIERGYNPSFTADGKWAVAQIKPYYSATREGKKKKKKDFDLPQDSLAIINLGRLTVEKVANAISFKMGKKGGDWIAYQSCDTTFISPKDLKNKEVGRPLIIRHLPSATEKVIKWVNSYLFDEKGEKVAVRIKKSEKDSLATDGIGFMALPDTSLQLIDRDMPYYSEPVFNRQGTKLAYLNSSDTVKSGTKRAHLYVSDLKGEYSKAEEISLAGNIASADGKDSLFFNQYTVPSFSYNGKRLIAGVAKEVAPDDTTIVDFETATLDIWRWDAPQTPPQEKHEVDKRRKTTYPVAIDMTDGSQVLVSNSYFDRVLPSERWDGEWATVIDGFDASWSTQWNYFVDSPVSVINLNNGEKKEVGNVNGEFVEMSPCGKYVLYYQGRDYFTYCTATGKITNISSAIPYPTWDEVSDIPSVPLPYGIMGWSENDGDVMVYDRYDIWRLDPSGKRAPESLTKENGRKNNITYRYVKLDAEQQYLKRGDKLVLSVLDNNDKRNGFATITYGSPAVPDLRMLDTYKFTQLKKAENADVYSWQKANFNTSPDIWVVRGEKFASAKKLSDSNPQMKDYNWGTAQLEKWFTYRGKESEGVLYVPEDFDPDKKYPMLVVFYERNSDELYRHYTMEPSWSWINYPFYVSRGYVIFVPDVHYTPGIPGECAYDYICSGVETLCEKYPWIDKERIGIDGQSWGGYQTAYLVTRTDMFACAGSGAPVSNMTSAYGGIRWESGSSRQAQYEVGQSRIGRTFWEAPHLYMANSPVFFADRVKTPLLIMHNDGDGAVPWYQGIEMFMALRRLHKPVWMLQYNGEAHNLKERRNRKDITIRLQQFFDHYLKGDPMPKWMKDGIPATRKGQEMNYQLIEE